MGAFLMGMLVPRVNAGEPSWVCSRDSLGWLGYHERHPVSWMWNSIFAGGPA